MINTIGRLHRVYTSNAYSFRIHVVLTTLFDLIADMVGNDMPVKLETVAEAKMVVFDLATPYTKL